MNKNIFSGRLTSDPELKTTTSGLSVTDFSLAVKGDKKGDTDFFDFTAFRETAEIVTKYCHKGDYIIVEGKLKKKKYTDRSGNERINWFVRVDSVEFTPGKKAEVPSAEAPEAPDMEPIENDEDLPF